MNNLQAVQFNNLTPPAALVNNASVTVAALDTRGFSYADILVALGATDIALTALKLQESDDNSTYTDVPLSDYSVAAVGTLPTATDDNHIFGWSVNSKGNRKRYLKPVITIGNGTAGAYISVIGLLSKAEFIPTTAAQRGFTQVVNL